ncbi:hypothetical protein EMIHUDRAFT_230844 [Emiliania huxleyi CCMP1516]|uniref:N-acetyltransferase domain-containing protein n=2 Tax=Emiliania huxleyi TaxID=2903 RepID=A0A0D3K9R1_EMIH1|nr:hypothetical protein EMIHUDRAFT_230844 [Emiliania huxleyi CCMP1516]EOD32496.1 hypothetical protein EMIHUDRAFT_230844 [Emiliania huxleyi CCMP1516]|eukprot:XP_005784925.1 hypothetical protein EMIHUDRAFT_230844 [Emiliania huxleyi CCMP1516]
MQALLDELCDTTPKHLDGLCEQLGQDEDLSGLHREDVLDGYWMTAHFHPLWALYGEFLKLFPSAVRPAAAAKLKAELDVVLEVVLGATSARAASSSPPSPVSLLAPPSGEPAVSRDLHASPGDAAATAAVGKAGGTFNADSADKEVSTALTFEILGRDTPAWLVRDVEQLMKESFDEWPATLLEYRRGYRALVALNEQKELLAACWFVRHLSYLFCPAFATRREFRGQGIGEEMMAELKSMADGTGLTGLSISERHPGYQAQRAPKYWHVIVSRLLLVGPPRRETVDLFVSCDTHNPDGFAASPAGEILKKVQHF